MHSGWFWTLTMAAPLAVGATVAAGRGLRQPPGLARGLAGALLAWGWLTLGVQALGAAEALRRGPLLAWSLAGLGSALLLRGRAPRPEAPDRMPDAPAWDLPAALAVGLALWSCLNYGVPSLMLPVKVVSDGPIYHLYFAARWWKEAALGLIPVPFGESAATYFPANGDAWFAWLIVAWGGDRLARVGQAPFLLISAATAYAMARRLGAGASASALAVAWFATCMPVLLFSFEPNVDTIFMAGYLLAAYFLLRYALGDDGPTSLALSGLAAGAALGSKPTAIVFVPVLLSAGGLVVLTRRVPFRARLAHLTLLVGSSLVLSAFWFARNWTLTGNPLYPAHLEVFGRVWLRGWFPTSAMAYSQFYIPRGVWAAFVDILLGVLDPRLAPVWLAATLGLWAPGRRPRHPADGWVWACAGLAVLNVALYWLVIPYRTQQRFMIQALGLAAVPLARLFDRSPWWRRAAVALLAVHQFTPQAWPFGRPVAWLSAVADVPAFLEQIPTAEGPLTVPMSPEGWRDALMRSSTAILLGGRLLLGAAVVSATILWARARIDTTRRWLAASLATLGIGAITCAAYEFGLERATGTRASDLAFPFFREYNQGWRALGNLTRGRPARIAYAGTNLPYYLMGRGLANDVSYVNVDAHPDWLLHDYHLTARDRGDPDLWDSPRPGWDRIHPDPSAWLENLRARGIQLLVVAKANPIDGWFNVADREEFPIERTWADARPDLFVPLYGVRPPDPQMKIYRLRPPQSSTDSVAGEH